MTLALEIISPERLLLARQVSMVVIPGTEGDLGILPEHAKLITSLRGGMIDIYEDDEIIDRFFVSGGFAEITETRCTVLADEIMKLADINRDTAAEQLTAAETEYREVDEADPTAWRNASDRLITAQARIDALAHE
ncbi:MAG: ATP synthase F1 subunit epsilon [Acidiphilium sp. 37-64-53]|uniref:ATP synthase F1 subunit epsilon n=1 Tax=Acidiphilium TaxID=522 RepID=UPI000BCF3FA1|nr:MULTISPECIES: ATP synthase F1 subunit epsilon [Acidiphilium]OYV59782.1 MAG: ATP synthase F1 subunit epsilon [Acidiphilium sp. 21-62-4]OYW03541.1 MAG: ATP synthase F1 subunit epsilon [Acidiphilium sp. 37-64-53]OZB29515.1 MAG: ATP synthase F1 subunit epsilon [Acidiphilium sp. 34-64-41]HQT84191.1 ATP synthase F1 subunit epsilon [Acidiphilium rubrum]